MGSFFDSQFRSAAMPVLFGAFSDRKRKAAMADRKGNVYASNLPVIWRATSIEEREEPNGDLVRIEVGQAVFDSKDLPVIDTLGSIVFDGDSWEIDPQEGRGIESRSLGQTVIHVKRRDPTTISRSGRRAQ